MKVLGNTKNMLPICVVYTIIISAIFYELYNINSLFISSLFFISGLFLYVVAREVEAKEAEKKERKRILMLLDKTEKDLQDAWVNKMHATLGQNKK